MWIFFLYIISLNFQNEHNPDACSKSGFTPLHIAAHYGNVAVAKALLSAGADAGRAAKHNITPLHVASKWGQLAMLDLLVEHGKGLLGETTQVWKEKRAGFTHFYILH